MEDIRKLLRVPESTYIWIVHAYDPVITNEINAMSILNFPLCLFIIGVVIGHIGKYDMVDRVSFRLSASIAACDIIFGIVQLVLNSDDITDQMGNLELKAMYFFHLLATNGLTFNTAMIALHLHLTAILNKQRLARKLSPWYEVAAWALTIMCSQFTLYFYGFCQKIKEYNIIVIGTDSAGKFRFYVWLIWGLGTLAIIYCLFVCISILFRLLPIWKRNNKNTFSVPGAYFNQLHDVENASFPHSSSLSSSSHPTNSLNTVTTGFATQTGSSGIGAGCSSNSLGSYGRRFNFEPDFTQSIKYKHHRIRRKSQTIKKKRKIAFAIFRISMYTLIPAICISIAPFYYSIPDIKSRALSVAIVVLQSLCGLLNFLVFIANPVLDSMWRSLLNYIKSKFNQQSYDQNQGHGHGHSSSESGVRSGGDGDSNDGTLGNMTIMTLPIASAPKSTDALVKNLHEDPLFTSNFKSLARTRGVRFDCHSSPTSES